ncbi:prolipoprotein diacylglyceryl transferase [Methylomonas sp. MED-D]|uniref:Phosphatidylglycerol--prolipoprotein diacylglyceryl transferase n=1 Tax=Methylomonas koyamae TaxID=702114 RepID=A0A177NI48_9GAMM|nr:MULTISPECIES: prolipoprotein diacylglyceryl transferase [Methylomonas]NJA05202.1 prolipoprotein diacylglyceryl transferase [Methylococcaceae bacterium WWC4]MDT4331609.1 prolipoprotein diacylglyceryl transferase [Methylomonas sp. MV1]OAI16730.1 prolipoprotein diacylglyceryl transferase [Methylomonas koyamae]OHX36287.1 prolipoprotein diacylglyceryl transferase [Methylomonas sp. LWB]WGS84251.1 prolipoprotein diacylglyceryl transferase [Methylomonas sp. UP202]
MHHLIWNIDPILFDIGFVKIRWYGLMFAMGFVGSFLTMQWMYQREGKNVEELDTLLWYMVIATILGARLGHTLLYDPAYYLSHPLKILAIWEGGLASHGATLGIILALYLYRRRYGDGFFWLLDRVSIPTALAGALIRIGNFFNSEILGTPSEQPWAVVFSRIDPLPRHPVQLYEAACYLAIYAICLTIYRKHADKPGFSFGCFLTLLFSVRFGLEYFKTEQAMYETAWAITTGQLLSIPFVLAGVACIVWSLKNRKAIAAA